MHISDQTGLVQQQVLDIVQMTLDKISQALAKGEKVELRNFGVFEVRMRKARVGRNPNAPNKDVPIPQRATVRFKPGKELREDVMKLKPAQIKQTGDSEPGSDKQSTSTTRTASPIPPVG